MHFFFAELLIDLSVSFMFHNHSSSLNEIHALSPEVSLLLRQLRSFLNPPFTLFGKVAVLTLPRFLYLDAYRTPAAAPVWQIVPHLIPQPLLVVLHRLLGEGFPISLQCEF